MLSALCATLFLGLQTNNPFSKPFVVSEPKRLALSPTIDGVLRPEEWDPLSVDEKEKLNTFFQWEPGMLHLAAKAPLGSDVIISLDRDANGWLVGNDNLEIRVTLKDGKPVASYRGLDGGGAEGPHWFASPGWELSSVISASSETNFWSFELTLIDPGVDLIPKDSGDAIGLRFDQVPLNSPATEAFLPRACTKLFLEYDREEGLPVGLNHKTEARYRSSVPGDFVRLRHTFNGNNDLKVKRIVMGTEGPSKDFTTGVSVPFPEFDRKNRSYIDYNTQLRKGVREGWYLQKSEVSTSDGVTGIIESSFRAAPFLDFDLSNERFETQPQTRVQRVSVFLRSNSTKRLDGALLIDPPAGWRVIRGSDRTFIIPNPRGSIRRTFELEIPAKAEGVFPIKFTADLAGHPISQVRWIQVHPSK